jgi:hypothetical protein
MQTKSIVRENAEKDPNYAPYCMPCPRLVRMKKIEPFFWKCDKCGAECDEREIKQEDIDKLDELQSKENDGRGISCVKTILFFLRHNKIDEARACRQNEGDKINSYPLVELQINKMFGCRTHLRKMCNHWLCVSLLNGTKAKTVVAPHHG